MLLRFRGGNALSPFRLEKLVRSLVMEAPQVSHICAEHWYFCEASRMPDQRENASLESLLDPSAEERPESEGENPASTGELLLVLPRPGTISPWSTKASDIVHHCGLPIVERLERGTAFYIQTKDEPFAELPSSAKEAVLAQIHDRMTEAVFTSFDDAERLFRHFAPAPLKTVDILSGGLLALQKANEEMGLALSPEEISYFADYFIRIGRNPTDVELMMFAQANSEHCRHKIFNAEWIIDGQPQAESLFSMIRNTHREHPRGTVVAYADNSAVIEGTEIPRFYAGKDNVYGYADE